MTLETLDGYGYIHVSPQNLGQRGHEVEAGHADLVHTLQFDQVALLTKAELTVTHIEFVPSEQLFRLILRFFNFFNLLVRGFQPGLSTFPAHSHHCSDYMLGPL